MENGSGNRTRDAVPQLLTYGLVDGIRTIAPVVSIDLAHPVEESAAGPAVLGMLHSRVLSGFLRDDMNVIFRLLIIFDVFAGTAKLDDARKNSSMPNVYSRSFGLETHQKFLPDQHLRRSE